MLRKFRRLGTSILVFFPHFHSFKDSCSDHYHLLAHFTKISINHFIFTLLKVMMKNSVFNVVIRKIMKKPCFYSCKSLCRRKLDMFIYWQALQGSKFIADFIYLLCIIYERNWLTSLLYQNQTVPSLKSVK